jgi:teichuronic acid biosynthesis glycosyltransferase TuaC
LIRPEVRVDFFTIKGKGIISYFKHISILRKYLKKNNYDIIHAHYGLCGIVSLLAKRKERIVTSFMGDDLVGSNKPDGSLTHISKIISRISIIMAQNFYDHAIVKSAEMMKLFKTGSQISLIPNGVDFNLFKQVQRDEALKHSLFDPHKKHIIFVANYLLAKRAVDFLQNSSVELHVLDAIPNNRLIYYYNSADALLMTSFHEGSPNVVKEAMACNCPVVCTPVGDAKWVIGHTEGCYVTSFSVDDVADKINKAIEYSATHGHTKGRERIIELGLGAENSANKILDVYKTILMANN